ncbi:Cupredoxin superfamily protein [Hibiscus syriacus]|uniref:Cupredoxin superfamily protein n=1 Tax=Hibiscus syriacus TaxID=106335 RepID=A0A6A2XUC7_HIBSY|nr:zinc finger protein ZAT5-like [Hibiscus syriacus]KAE8670435.1 Cupredoxin superfamily protein [Hibiscus syriacus]
MVVMGRAMEAPTCVTMGFKDHTNIVKGKRTKRSRSQSPIPFAIACNDYICDENSHEGMKNYSQYLSPSSSSFEYLDSTTEEEEDMAHCLIFLAQGQPRESHKTRGAMKFISRKFMEATSNGTGKARHNVFECKTCNRTFLSFQVLHGHSASHKKPKAAMYIGLFKAAREDEGPNNRGLNGNDSRVMVHECSICGAEFASGQALGGHMRRHRGSVCTVNVNVITADKAFSLTVPLAIESEKPKKPRNVLSLSLDLNLPAPQDDLPDS